MFRPDSSLLISQNGDEELKTSEENSDHAGNTTQSQQVDDLRVFQTTSDFGTFPYRKLWVIYFAVACDALAQSSATPYLPAMCRSFGVPEEVVGVYVGLLVGSLSLANCFSASLLGHLSDVYGRKPLILSGLLVVMCGTFFFGFSPNVAVAIAIRSGMGLFDANLAITKAVVADVTDRRGPHRAVANSYLGAVFGFSRAISSAVGGFTAGLFFDNAFIAPCMFSALPVATSFVCALLFFKETLPNAATHRAEHAEKKDVIGRYRTSLLIIAKDRDTMLVITCVALASFGNGGLFVAIVLFCTTDRSHHGLGFEVKATSAVLFYFGIFCVFFSMVFFKKLKKRLTLKRLTVLGVVALFACVALFPLAELPMGTAGGLYAAIALVGVLMSVMGCGFMLTLPMLSTMLSNVTNPDVQGVTQGLCQSISSLLRSLGPVITGATQSVYYTNSNAFFMFLPLSSMYLICLILMFFMSSRVEGLQHSESKVRELAHVKLVEEEDDDDDTEMQNGSSAASVASKSTSPLPS